MPLPGSGKPNRTRTAAGRERARGRRGSGPRRLGGMTQCPYCGEPVEAKSGRCELCGESLERRPRRRAPPPLGVGLILCAVLDFLAGALTLFGAVGSLMAIFMAASMGGGGRPAGPPMVIFAVMIALYLAVAAALIGTGVGILKRKNWARILGIVVSALVGGLVLLGLGGMVIMMAVGAGAGGGLGVAGAEVAVMVGVAAFYALIAACFIAQAVVLFRSAKVFEPS